MQEVGPGGRQQCSHQLDRLQIWNMECKWKSHTHTGPGRPGTGVKAGSGGGKTKPDLCVFDLYSNKSYKDS